MTYGIALVLLGAGSGLVLVALVGWALLTAPEGYQDDEGYHDGPDPRTAEMLLALRRAGHG